VQEQLFPADEDTPGASDFHAIDYLRNTLENPAADGEDREFITNGVGWLNDLTREHHNKLFLQLDAQQKENMLRQIEQSRAGRNWLSLLLTYLLEALLSDPVYGGNTNETGWQWLQHRPGFPRPPADKTWFKLTSPVYFRRKA
jgi:gluconate 2-dehydrogenase gamma chain